MTPCREAISPRSQAIVYLEAELESISENRILSIRPIDFRAYQIVRRIDSAGDQHLP